jgi:hypothetical protein
VHQPGLFESRELAFASNALYRYWNMVGVKDRPQECLIGQAGEIEPVYDRYALGFFLFDPGLRRAYYPQYSDFSRLPAPLAQRDFWTSKLDGSGMQMSLPASVAHVFDLFRVCRATLLMLSDDGEIHPGPTIYDSFWIRDSSVEGIACALAGDLNLPERQFGGALHAAGRLPPRARLH